MKRKASAQWQGDLKQGRGTITTGSGVLQDSRYGFATRFGDERGTNPEELVAAAHAGCFAMAFSLMLGEAGFPPETIDASSEVTLDKQGEGFAVTQVHLVVSARIPDIDEQRFQQIATQAKENCPISKLLNAPISMESRLV